MKGEECLDNSTRYQEIDIDNNNLIYMDGAIVITTGTHHFSVYV